MPTLRESIAALFGKVPWLQNEFGAKLLGVIGLGADATVDLGKIAVRSSWLLHEDCPPDALPLIAAERGIERAPAETEAQHRARLHAAWDLWGEAGTPSFAANALEPFGFDPATVTVRYQAEPTWAGDENEDNFSRFWVLTTDTGPFSVQEVGSWAIGDATTVGLTATPADVAAMRRFLRKFKAGHELGVDFIVAPASNVVGMFEVGAVGAPVIGDYWGSIKPAQPGVIRYRLGQFVGSQYPFTAVGGGHATTIGATAKIGAFV